MNHLSARWSLGLLHAAFLCPWVSAFAETPAGSWTSPEGKTYTAVTVIDDTQQSSPEAIDLALILDMSASQAGEPFQRTLRLTESIVDGLVGGSRVRILFTDPRKPALPAKASAVGSESLASALQSLRSMSPVGASDLPGTFTNLDSWLADSSGELPKKVVLIGDGKSTLAPLTSASVKDVSTRCLEHRAAFHFVPTDENVQSPAMRSLAMRTGGRVEPCSQDVQMQVKGTLRALFTPIFYPTSVKSDSSDDSILPRSLPPIRSDRGILVMLVGPAREKFIQMEGTRRGAAANLRIRVQPVTLNDGAHLKLIAETREARPDEIPIDDADRTLERARAALAMRAEAMIAHGKEALAQRRLEDAERFFESASNLGSDLEAEAGQRAVVALRTRKDPRPARQPVTEDAHGPTPNRPSSTNKTDVPSKEPASDPIEAAKALAAIEKQKLTSEVTAAISDARQRARKSLDLAIQRLKLTLEAVEASGVDDNTKVKLRSRLESELRVKSRELQEHRAASVERQQREAASHARAVASSAELNQEQQKARLLDQYRHLMAEGQYARASDLAEGIEEDSPEALAARLQSKWSDRWARIESLENAKSNGWWEALHSAETSAIPQADSVPVAFPPPAQWEALSARREKYREGFDLAPVSPAEESIRKALARPVSFKFKETPLEDVIEFLRDYTGANIVLDAEGLDAEGVGLDEPVTLELEGVSLRSALNLLLRPIRLSYLIRDDVLQITSVETADAYMMTKVYPVADLVIPIQNFNGGGFGVNNAFNPTGGPQGQGQGQGQGQFGQGLNGAGNNFNFQDRMSNELRDVLEREFIRDQSQDDRKGKPSPVEAYLAEHREADESLRSAVASLVSANRHGEVVNLIRCAARHQPIGDWMFEALALSGQISGVEPAEVRTAILSSLEGKPHDLPTRWKSALLLARVGQKEEAISVLRQAAELAPDSVNTLYLLAQLSSESLSVDSLTWAGEKLLGREWSANGDEVHDRTKAALRSAADTLRAEQRDREALRVEAVLADSPARDIEVVVEWEGTADIDLQVIEPGDWLCSSITPRTVAGGVLSADQHPNRERYTAWKGLTGPYEIRLRKVWGNPIGEVATVTVTTHKGTPQERIERHAVKLDTPEPNPVQIALKDGRRQQWEVLGNDPILFVDRGEEQAVHPRLKLRRMLQAGDMQADPAPPGLAAAGAVFLGRSIPFVTGAGGFGLGGAVAFDPVIEVLQDGTTLTAQAVVSADRRYVRMTTVPLIQSIEPIANVRTVNVGGTAQ